MFLGRTDPSGRVRARCWACLGLSAIAVVAAGCSTGGNRKDQNYGKDVGTVYEPPEASVDSVAASDGGTTDATPSVGDGDADTTAGADGGDAALAGDDALAGDAG
jgi:hypothetical protein